MEDVTVAIWQGLRMKDADKIQLTDEERSGLRQSDRKEFLALLASGKLTPGDIAWVLKILPQR